MFRKIVTGDRPNVALDISTHARGQKMPVVVTAVVVLLCALLQG